MEMNYRRAPYFQEIYNFTIAHLCDYGLLADLNTWIIEGLSYKLRLHASLLKASNYDLKGKNTELLVNIVKRFKGSQYLSGQGAKKYMDESLFEKAGIELVYTDFKHPEYNQLWGEFIPNLSILDLLFNHGFEGSRKILLEER